MSGDFSSTMRSLNADRFRRSIAGLLVVAVLLGAWTAWLFLSRVARYETTDSARLEVDRAIHLIQAPYTGRVVKTGMVLGAQVSAGDLLIELDSNAERLQLEEERSRLRVLAPQIEALRQQEASTEQARSREQQATLSAIEEAKGRVREAEQSARFTDLEFDRLRQLRDARLIPERDFARGESDARKNHAAVESLQQVSIRLEREQQTRDSDRDAAGKRIQASIQQLEGQRTTSAAAIERLQYEIEKRRIRAPVSGRLGEAQTLRIGAVVREGDKLGAVIPSGTLRIVADFLPPAALGRIRPGQPVRMRLEGFPWAQYGSVAGTVSRVASEIRDGRVRVECSVSAHHATPIPLQHGLPGSVEVQVERISPAALVLRAAGQMVSAPKTTFAAPNP